MNPEDLIQALQDRSAVVCEQDAVLMRRAAIALQAALSDQEQGVSGGYQGGQT